MNSFLKLYFNDHLKELPLHEVMTELKKHDGFSVFCEFINPKTNCLVQGNYLFYPEPQQTKIGYRFIAEHDGIALYIPTDFNWWIKKQTNGGAATIKYPVAILKKGCYINVDFTLNVLPAIRIDSYICKKSEPFYSERLLHLKNHVARHCSQMRHRAIILDGPRGMAALARYNQLSALKSKLNQSVNYRAA